jgi:hypothetical protein
VEGNERDRQEDADGEEQDRKGVPADSFAHPTAPAIRG